MNNQCRKSGRRAERPFVFVNMAMTADGKIATANRQVASFGSPRDLAHLHFLRARADAIMVGARTVESGSVLLDAGGARYRRLRIRKGLAAEPLRIVVSGSGSVDPGAAIFRLHSSPLLVITTGRIKGARRRRLEAVADVVKAAGEKEIDFAGLLIWLRREWNVRHLLCEGGGELNAALFRAGLVDELHLTVCPWVFGGRKAPTIATGLGVPRLAQARAFRCRSVRRVDDELFLTYAAVGAAIPRFGCV